MLKMKMTSARVEQEARDIFWGFFSGTTLKMATSSGGRGLVVFGAALVVARLMGVSSHFETCGISMLERPEICHAVSLQSLMLFLPSALLMVLGSCVSSVFRTGRLFQQSAFETVFVLFYCASALEYLGIEGVLEFILLSVVFAAMYSGYRVSFIRFLRGEK